MNNIHVPVLLNEVISYLDPQPGQNFIDATLGGGGYTLEIAKRISPQGQVLAIDLDQQAISRFSKELAEPGNKKIKKNIKIVQGNFRDLKQIVYDQHFNQISGIVLDLGLSSNQLQDSSRGFSFQGSGFLDMRFDPVGNSTTAHWLINNLNKEKLNELLRTYGEEPLARPISKIISETRRAKEIYSVAELAELVSQVYKKYYHRPGKIHPATRTFQALRIAVNAELENLAKVLPSALELLPSGGRLAVVSFHSLEDRIVKNFFRQESGDCICPKEIPVCCCSHQAQLKILTRKPIIANEAELNQNSRARSAKLRVAQKI
ncbi:MAG: 16S rRNA (cytosine(1402)-N(4))-methyltransferase RsmH [Patescibacteria group bacterium]